MTRFARGRGSKSSNERLPEEATSWHVMKLQLQEKKSNKHKAQPRERIIPDWGDGDNVKGQWAEFEESGIPSGGGEKRKKKQKNYVSLKPKGDISVDEESSSKKIDEVHKVKGSKVHKKQTSFVSSKKIKEFAKLTVDSGEGDLTKESEKHVVRVNQLKKKKLSNGFIVEDISDSVGLEPSENPVSQKGKKNRKHKVDTQSKDGKLSRELTNNDLSNRFETECNEEPVTVQKRKKIKEKKKRRVDTQSVSQDLETSTVKTNNERNFQQRGNKNYSSKKKPEPMWNKNNDYNNRNNKIHKRRKPENPSSVMFINGKEIEIIKYDGFPVKKEDADRLKELRKKLIDQGVPRSDVVATMKLERRRAEKALARERKKVCFQCRKAGHLLSECPELGNSTESATGICFKCGSTEHTHFQCKVTRSQDFRYAECFICKEQGHIARQCPDNARGLYPKGGACNVCGDVTHLKKDCPDLMKEKEQQTIRLGTLDSSAVEVLDEDLKKRRNQSFDNKKKSKQKTVKF